LGEISPHGQYFLALGEKLAEIKSPKFHLNKAKILAPEESFSSYFSKKLQNFYQNSFVQIY
jgi:hypothetical protein